MLLLSICELNKQELKSSFLYIIITNTYTYTRHVAGLKTAGAAELPLSGSTASANRASPPSGEPSRDINKPRFPIDMDRLIITYIDVLSVA